MHSKLLGEITLEDELNRLLKELRTSLSKAVCDSPDVLAAVRKMHESGYMLHVVVDRRGDSTEEESLQLTVASPNEPRRGEPVFRIDGEDLGFLRSIGIDPTRRSRRRRGR